MEPVKFLTNMIMEKVNKVFESEGYSIEYSESDMGCAATIRKTGECPRLMTGWGINSTDVDIFIEISKIFHPKSIFVVGNAFGYSTFCLAEIFKDAVIDVIDAEIEGEDNKMGNIITRHIASRHYPNVRLTIGFSPEDLEKAVREEVRQKLKGYDLVFIDGKHTNEQVLKDFIGISFYSSEKCVFLFHDIGLFNMYGGFAKIRKYAKTKGFDTFCPSLRQTRIGMGIVVKNVPEITSLIKKTNPLSDLFGFYKTYLTPIVNKTHAIRRKLGLTKTQFKRVFGFIMCRRLTKRP